MGQGNSDKLEGLGKGIRRSRVRRAGWCSLCPMSGTQPGGVKGPRVIKGMQAGTRDGGTGPLRSFLGSGLAGGRPDARSTSTPPSRAWVSSTGKRARALARLQDAARQRRDLYTGGRRHRCLRGTQLPRAPKS